LIKLLVDRYSCRAYDPDPLSRGVIEQILEIAARTPSWCNTQPWHTLITEGAETDRLRQALSAEAATSEGSPDFEFPARYDGVYQQRRRECAWQLYESVGIARGDREASAVQTAKNFEFFGAPHVAIVTTDATLGVYGAVDCGLYVNSFLLAAQSLGVGAIPQAAVALHSGFLRSYFDLPADRLIVCGISFGRPDRSAPVNSFRTARQTVDQTVTWVR
jgi:nitroreductase